jgi:hypothetical protein
MTPAAEQPLERIFVLPLMCTLCNVDVGAILSKTRHVNDVIKKEGINTLCKPCFERLQISMRYQQTPYIHLKANDEEPQK